MEKSYICLVILVAYFATSATGKPIKDNDKKEVEKTTICKELCDLCGCTGFYCGDECICECNKQSGEDLTCLQNMQENSEKLQLPFEVLIQGPVSNRFVRSLLKSEADEDEVCLMDNSQPKRRSTISIYRPDQITQQIVELKEPKSDISLSDDDDDNVVGMPSELSPTFAYTINNDKSFETVKRQINNDHAQMHYELQENEMYANAPLLKRDVAAADVAAADVAVVDNTAVTKSTFPFANLFDGSLLGSNLQLDGLLKAVRLEDLGAFNGLDMSSFSDQLAAIAPMDMFKNMDLGALNFDMLGQMPDLGSVFLGANAGDGSNKFDINSILGSFQGGNLGGFNDFLANAGKMLGFASADATT